MAQVASLVPTDRQRDPLFNRACAHCCGYCCLQGNAARAFLSNETIRDLLAQMDLDRPGQLLERYVRFIPDSSFENSCVYNAVTGGALSRDLRSDECNSFYCEQLCSIDHGSAAGAAKLLLVAEENDRPVSVKLIATDW